MLRIRTPASSSDFRSFVERFGIPVTDIRYDFDWVSVNNIKLLKNFRGRISKVATTLPEISILLNSSIGFLGNGALWGSWNVLSNF